MDLNRYIKLIQKALKYNYNVKTTMTTYEYFNDETNRFSNNYILRVNNKQRIHTNSKIKLLLELQKVLEEAKQNNDA